MKTVFDNSMVAHVWAQRSRAAGRSPSGNLFFEGDTLWSYGKHFAVARFLARGESKVLLTCRGYSISTSRHISYAHRAIPSHYTVLHCPYPDKDATGNRDWYASQITSHIDAMNAMRPGEKVRRAKRAAMAAEVAQRFNEYLAALPASERGKCKPFALDMDTYAADVAKMRAKEAKAKTKAEREARERAAENVRKWLAGDPDVRLYGYRDEQGSALLRVNGDTVQTSLGAEVPLEHVRRALKYYHLIPRGTEWVRDRCTRSFHWDDVTLGHFTLDVIGADGNVRAGCHFISAAVIASLEAQLG